MINDGYIDLTWSLLVDVQMLGPHLFCMYTKKMDIDYFQELAKRKRNMKHTWRIGRDDNSRNVARAAIAYRELAKPLPWEGNMKVFLQNMPTQFSDPGLKYSAQRQAFQVQLQDLEDEMDKLTSTDDAGHRAFAYCI